MFPGCPAAPLPAAADFAAELRLREPIPCFEEGEVRRHLFLRKISPVPREFQKRPVSAGQPADAVTETLSVLLDCGEREIRVLAEGDRLHRHICVDVSIHRST